MMQSFYILRLTIGCGVPGVLFAALLIFRNYWRSYYNIRVPVSERQLRPPGESLRLQLEDLDWDLNFWTMLILLWSIVAAMTFPISIFWPVALIIDVLFLSLFLWKFLQILRKRDDYRLGFSGERVVGEYLNELVSHGCRVFHDFPADPKWNIDHVIIALSGVYAVETKTRRKKKAPPGKKDQIIIFENDCLYFPHGSDKRAIFQARVNANWLSNFLTKATAQPVSVVPILTFPGWFIELKARSEYPIVNPKGIKSVVLSSRSARLDPQTMQRIAFQVEQKCRDVEF
jgi:hypothetical protein